MEDVLLDSTSGAYCLAGCRSHLGDRYANTHAYRDVTNVRDSLIFAVLDGLRSGSRRRFLWNCIAEWYSGSGCFERERVLNADSVEFSAAYRTFKDEAYLKLADKSQRYFIDTFIDKDMVGYIGWSILTVRC